jgi:spermidine synthase
LQQAFLRSRDENEQRLLIVGACFFLSGFCALLYQVTWLRSLGLIFGTSHIAVSTVLAAYMTGLALGAAIAAKFLSRVSSPLRLYGLLEGIIGVTALLVPLALAGSHSLLVILFGNQPEPVSAESPLQVVYYLVMTFLVLSVPTVAMGATLPLLSRHAIHQDREIGPRVGLLYGLNTVGAVVGTLISAFFLLPYLGLMRTLVVGAVVNLLIYAVARRLGQIEPAETVAMPPEPIVGSIISGSSFHWIMPMMLMSGIASFTLEVLWTRLLSYVFGGTIYAFAIMLACFLAGIALGGVAAGRISGTRDHAARLFILAQVFIAFLSLGSYLVLCFWRPEGGGMIVRAAYAFVVIVPSTLFIGATYPLAVRIATREPASAGRITGQLYAWNTTGAIVGALLAGFILLPTLGFGSTLKFAMLCSLILAAGTAWRGIRSPRLGIAAIACLVLTLVFQPQRPDLLIYSSVKGAVPRGEERYYGVGRSATILLREVNGFFNLSSNGLSESAVGRAGMPPFNLSQKWLAGLPTLSRPDARSMLIIGLGGGIALEGVPPHIKDLDVIELEPEVVAANRAVSSLRDQDPLDDLRLKLIINDARNALGLTSKRYDTIVSQPSHPWTGGASHLYTAEFLNLVRRHLETDGVFLQWINTQFLDEALLRTLMATVSSNFDYVELYQPAPQVLMFLASDAPLEIWDGHQGAVIALKKDRRHYNRLGMRSLEDVLAMLLLDDAGVRAFSEGAPTNTDDQNRLAFFSRADSRGLTAQDLLDLFADTDPLTNPQSRFHSQYAATVQLPQIAEQLLAGNFVRRAFEMGRAVADPADRATIDGLGRDHSGDQLGAEAAFLKALKIDADHRPALLALLRMHLGDFARGDISPDIAAFANRLTGPDRRVLEGWVYGAMGDFERLRTLDRALAAVTPSSLFYPIGVKLRVDWRIVATQRSGNSLLAQDALDILDDLLAFYWNMDLYVLRSVCGFLADQPAVFVESVAAALTQVQEQLDILEKDGLHLDESERKNLETTLIGMRDRLSMPFSDSIRRRADAVATELNVALARVYRL